ncbi:hypothetical protein WJX73_002578 [Symbiochloris irregularis]|uniref:tRNA-binding domain-containing protein n=1 Tax=Symbiochloris irregularis TaxID=706552 RepID=A0AAW1PH45_9CHLO
MVANGQTVAAADEQTVRTFSLVLQICGLTDRFRVAKKRDTELQTSDGLTLTGPNTICRYLVSCDPSKKDVLLGKTASEAALVADWLSFRNETDCSGEQQLAKVNEHLTSRVYLCGHHLTLADLVVYGALHRPVANFPTAQANRFCNIVRYVDFLQHTVDREHIFPPIAVTKIPFKAPGPITQPVKEDRSKAAAPPSSGSQGPASATSKAPGASKEASSAAPPPAADQATKPAPAAAKAATKKGSDKGPAKAAASDAEAAVDVLDLRVGKILSIDRHPNAESLYVEQIDLGEDQPRQVVSGLVKFVPIEQMQDRRVVVVANLKPAKMRDVVSSGMVLCASNAAHDAVTPLLPPEGAAIGERVAFEGHNANDGRPEQLNPKKKIFEKIALHLKTGADGIARYKDVPFQTTGGPVTATIAEGTIS